MWPPSECKTALEAAAELYTDMSRLSTAGKVYKQIAEMYESNHDGENALLDVGRQPGQGCVRRGQGCVGSGWQHVHFRRLLRVYGAGD